MRGSPPLTLSHTTCDTTKEKPAYPLFTMSNPKGMPIESVVAVPEGQSVGQWGNLIAASEDVSGDLHALSYQVSDGTINLTTSPSGMTRHASSEEGALVQTLVQTPSELLLAMPLIENTLNQILMELYELKLSHEDAHRKTNEQFGQINASILQLFSHMSQVEQSVFHLEDSNNEHET
ncbi:hypothetical protein NDU88_008232 [Pleurodeles waltl]|uniref:Uncharacterized protein n=1 Tax=Pleurodeles waltl TaxID=8319 RepID=A0AAV7RSE8_PLEWA|nr:hypothetical protein NDU88_008232 [Pleurodeles waltl]